MIVPLAILAIRPVVAPSLNLSNSEFENMAYAKPALWSFQKAFLDGLEDEVLKLSKGLPQHGSKSVPKLEEWIVQALRSQQPSRIKKVVSLQYWLITLVGHPTPP